MYEQSLVKIIEPIKKTTISRLNKGKKWKFKTSDNSVSVDNKNKRVTIYALNYNVLRIMSGLAGLVFTN